MVRPDGSAGDADYGVIGRGYAHYRQPEPRIAAHLHAALGGARSVVDVGAGAGSYEPVDRFVMAVEPSATMRAQHPARARGTVLAARAERLPFPNRSFEGAMASFTVHQWSDLDAGLRELRRVTSGPVAVLTCDPRRVERFWLARYAPEVLATEARRYPSLDRLLDGLGGGAVQVVPVPWDCVDGFAEAYFGRPERLLDPGARRANSAWSFVDDAVHARFERELAADLESGAWDERWGHLRETPELEGSLVLVIGPGSDAM